ncbi:MAG: SDR family oxidoreductase [Chloroflexi bacterium]|nr:MAG: short-chain dehydrogenase [Phototrophicales bacterium]RMF82687.1 MAG: SDR family oxidoreductase [Chloroflexota bacterium]
MSDNTLQSKVVLVTGGGGGIGSAICRRFADAGASIVITYKRNKDQAEGVAASLRGGNHLVSQTPVDDTDAQTRLAEVVAQKYGKLDILVNNAGITKPVPHDDLDMLSDSLIDEIFRVNVRGAIASIRAMRSLLEASGDGLVVNISSIAGRTAVGSNVAYCASKAALDNITMSLARALAPTIRVVSVSPGWVNGEYAQRMPPEILQQQRDFTPLRRIAEAEDVAAAVYAVATQLRFTTGAIIPVDGGRPLGL